MVVAIALWGVTGTVAMPISAEQCADMSMVANYDQSQHHVAMPHHESKKPPAQQHECCKKKPKSKPVRSESNTPICPMHEGTMPRTCGMAEVTCCAVVNRDDSRRVARPEKSETNSSPNLLTAMNRTDERKTMLERWDRHLRDGLRYDRPVFDLKSDLRV